jgi:hypothetical protein
MRMTRDELVQEIEKSVKWGCADRIYSVLVARGDFRLHRAIGLVPKFAVVVSGFEQARDESGGMLVEMEGEIQVLFGEDGLGVHLEDLDLEFLPLILRVEDGHCLDTGSQPSLPYFVLTLVQLPTKEAVINGKTATIRFYRPLTGWEGFFLCRWLRPNEPYWLKAGNLTEIRMSWRSD